MRRTPLAAVTALVLLVAAPAVARAEQVDWSGVDPLSGTVDGSDLVLEVEEAGTYPIVVIDDPAVGPPRFSVDATIRFEDVADGAYLEMWTVLDDGSRYFTRTLADTGPMAAMIGTSEVRPISLPFELGVDGPTPARLEINLVTAGSGRFWLGPLTLSAETEAPTTTSSAPSTTVAQAVTVTSTAPSTSTTAEVAEEEGDGAVGWLLAALAAGLAGLIVAGVARSRRLRRNEEQRRMDAVDSLKS